MDYNPDHNANSELSHAHHADDKNSQTAQLDVEVGLKPDHEKWFRISFWFQISARTKKNLLTTGLTVFFTTAAPLLLPQAKSLLFDHTFHHRVSSDHIQYPSN